MLRELRSFVVAARGRSRADRAVPEGIAWELIGLLGEAADLIREPRGGGEAPEDPEEVEALWERLRRRSPAERLLLVEEGAEYRSRALAERVAAASREEARGPGEARELAALADTIAATPC